MITLESRTLDGRLRARCGLILPHREYEPGRASKYICPFSLRPQDRVLHVPRVSGREHRRNLIDQRQNLRDVIRSTPARIVGNHEIATSGQDPNWLYEVVDKARDVGANVILAESTDRLIPYWHFHSNDRPNLQATDQPLREVAKIAGDITLMCHFHPDATPKEVRRYQRKRGQKCKCKKGGRKSPGYKKRRRCKLKIRVIQLLKQVEGNREIGRTLGVSESTVRRWRKRYQKFVVRHFSAKPVKKHAVGP